MRKKKERRRLTVANATLLKFGTTLSEIFPCYKTAQVVVSVFFDFKYYFFSNKS